ncbi:CLAVATA3/ESR [Hirschfeldia incana]|nr:CLAVATA3/ESR [Hirschfeldia incana]
MCIFCIALKSQLALLPSFSQSLNFSFSYLSLTKSSNMSRTHLNRSILIYLLLLLLTSIASSRTAGANRTMTTSSRTNFRYRTHRFVPRVHLPYYVTPCHSFSRPYARSMCLELQRIHRSTRKQPLVSPPPPPEIDPRYGVDKRLVPSGPNPLHN